MRYRSFMVIQGFLLGLAASLPAAGGPYQSPLDEPALTSPLAARWPMLAVAAAGKRLVAVGQRGHIVYSDDGGNSWQQARVPVSTDLVAVSFPTEKRGWAVGHGGVVLHSGDGGASWVKQLDGKRGAELAVAHLQSRAAADPAIEKLLAREKRLAEDGGTQPLMAVHFENERIGYVVGTFNRIFRTDDGGQTWTPWMDRIDNPDELHFYAVVGGAGSVWVAGEQGMVWRLDGSAQRFEARPLPYQGSVFGLLPQGPNALLAFGLRGSVYRSADEGKSWEKVPMPTSAGITTGLALADGGLLLATQAGEIVASHDGGKTFAPLKPQHPMAYYGIAPSPSGGLVLAGSGGVRTDPGPR